MLNRVTLIGRLAQDPAGALRYTQSGTAFLPFTLAVNRSPDKNGNSRPDWVDCIAFRKTAENIARYLSKGSLAAVEGRIQTRAYQTSEGSNRKAVEVVAGRVVFLGKKEPGSDSSGTGKRVNAGPAGDWEDFDLEINIDDLDF